MVKNIINNAVFRVFAPIFHGVTLYILILLIFDSIQQLSQNFFSTEAFLSVILTYLLFELMRLYILLVDKKCSDNCSNSKRILIQGGGCVGLSLFVTSLIISFYFSKLVGFNAYRTELIVFNTMFLITSILYNMIYFSFFYLNRINITQLDEESMLRKNVEIELDTFKNKINPEFLYHSLETLISLTKKNVEEADKFILKLSDVYRNILSTKNSELVCITEEFKILKTLIEIFNYKFNNKLNFKFENSIKESKLQLISGTLVVIVEDIINRSIISDIHALEINCKLDNGFLKFYHPIQNKLIQVFSKQTEIRHLKKAYHYYGKMDISIDEENNIRTYYIPVFELEN
ncbi:MAG: histidine kinase [Bacteroidales bacterium]|nr:histidine kinase [Bacteroidales bacterium]